MLEGAWVYEHLVRPKPRLVGPLLVFRKLWSWKNSGRAKRTLAIQSQAKQRTWAALWRTTRRTV